jgi:multiple sugar transport system substrate-binding protein
VRMPRVVAVAGCAAAVFGMAACSSSGTSKSSNSSKSTTAKSITVWSEENDADRIVTTKAIAAKFTAATGIQVKLVGVDGNQLPSLVSSDAAAGKLPDVIGALPLNSVQFLASNHLVNSDAAAAVINDLGRNTFDAQPLSLTQYKGKQAAVPSDAWVQLLMYRKDLFEKAGLGAPNTFDSIKAAAQKLNSPEVAGITMATDPADTFTEQTFQYFALANGCEMVDSSGNVTLNSQPCKDTFTWYTDLVNNYSVRGTQTVDTTRATYFAGKAAMFVWSSYVLDEMAGLRNDALPTCAQCKHDPTFLAKNTGIVTSVTGSDSSTPAQYGEIGSWAITSSANASASEKFVEYMLNEGYTGWLGLSAEGKFPVRNGTASDPQKFTTAWGSLKTGVSTKAPLSEFYPQDVLKALANGPNTIKQWGLTQGQGALVAAAAGQLVIPKAIAAAANGKSADAAAQQAEDAVNHIKSTLK